MRRTGPRGAGQWKAISWDDALAEMTAVFDRIRRESGPEYLALCQEPVVPTRNSPAVSFTPLARPTLPIRDTTASCLAT